MSNRLDVLKALTAHIQGITPANNYAYDLSKSVFRGRHTFGANDPIPMVSILESANTRPSLYAGENDSVSRDNWPLLVQGFVDDDVMNPTDPAYLLMDAVETRLLELIQVGNNGKPLFPSVYMLGGLIADLHFGPGTVRPPTEQVSSKAFFYLPVRVTLAR